MSLPVNFSKGVKIMGSEADDTITADGGDHIINGGAGTDSITLGSSGATTIVFGASATENGQNNIFNFTAGTTPDGDVLDFSQFVTLTGGLEGTGAPVAGTFEYLTAGAIEGGTDIAGKIFLWQGNDTTGLANLIDSTPSDGKLGLADGEKAVVLYKAGLLNGAFSSFKIAYITGSGSNNETIDLVGSVNLGSDNELIAANFGIGTGS